MEESSVCGTKVVLKEFCRQCSERDGLGEEFSLQSGMWAESVCCAI